MKFVRVVKKVQMAAVRKFSPSTRVSEVYTRSGGHEFEMILRNIDTNRRCSAHRRKAIFTVYSTTTGKQGSESESIDSSSAYS